MDKSDCAQNSSSTFLSLTSRYRLILCFSMFFIGLTLTIVNVMLTHVYQLDNIHWPWLAGVAVVSAALIAPFVMQRYIPVTLPAQLKKTLHSPWLWLAVATIINGTVLFFGFNQHGATRAFGGEAFHIRTALPVIMSLIIFFALWHEQREQLRLQPLLHQVSALGLLMLNLWLVSRQYDLFLLSFVIILYFAAGQTIKGLLGRSLQLVSALIISGGTFYILSRPSVFIRLTQGWLDYRYHADGSGAYLAQSTTALNQGGWFGGDLSLFGQIIQMPSHIELFALPLVGLWLGKTAVALIILAIAVFTWLLWQQRNVLHGVPRYVLTAFIGLFVYNHIFAIGAPLALVPLIGSSYGVAFLGGNELGVVAILMAVVAVYYSKKV